MAGPTYEKGQGPEQLPQGGATEVNDQANTLAADAGAAQVAAGASEAWQAPAGGTGEPPAPDALAPEAQPAPHPINDLALTQAPEVPVTYSPQSEDDKSL